MVTIGTRKKAERQAVDTNAFTNATYRLSRKILGMDRIHMPAAIHAAMTVVSICDIKIRNAPAVRVRQRDGSPYRISQRPKMKSG